MPRVMGIFSVFAGVTGLLGCAAAGAQVPPATAAIPARGPLGIVAYNYTNRYIDSFTVNGAGDGNVFVSSPTSGGGGTVCCAAYVPGIRSKVVTIRWQTAGCVYYTTTNGARYKHIYHDFKEIDVSAETPIPENAKYLEVHFYPDGSVKVALTAQESPRRLVLAKSREDKSNYPPCPDDQQLIT